MPVARIITRLYLVYHGIYCTMVYHEVSLFQNKYPRKIQDTCTISIRLINDFNSDVLIKSYIIKRH